MKRPFLVVSNVIHYRNHQVPKNLAMDCLENFASICDKYDSPSALAPSSTVSLQTNIVTSAAKRFQQVLIRSFMSLPFVDYARGDFVAVWQV
jgi:hypothetical protein